LQALVLASQETLFKHIFDSTIGVIFFGTPHQGSGVANYATTIARVSSSIALKPAPGLLQSLKHESPKLAQLTGDFKQLLDLKPISIVSFYETRTMKIVLGKLVSMLTVGATTDLISCR
jgi:hypothetical protein